MKRLYGSPVSEEFVIVSERNIMSYQGNGEDTTPQPEEW